MPYATLADMQALYGQAEMVRLTAPEGDLDGPVVGAKADRALADATAIIDSYLGRRYAVPLPAPIDAGIVRAACTLARYDLAHGEHREPTEQMRAARKDTIAWLEQLATGTAVLPGGVALAGAAGAGAMRTDRARDFSSANLGGW